MTGNIKEKLTGVFPPLTTPFVNQQVAYDKLAENIEKMNQTRLRGYMPLGSNGEFKSLTDEEALKVVEVVMKHKAKDKVIIAGTGRESAYATIEFTKKVADLGVDFASVITPHYFAKKMDDDALIRFYTAVGDASPIPIMLYNVPGYAGGVTVSAHVITVLSQHPNIVGMKDTSKEDIGIYTGAVPEGQEFYILAGSISKFYDGLTKGAVGGVLSIADFLPEECCEIQELFMAGKLEEAKQLSDRLRNLAKEVSGKHGVAGVKAAMNLLGYNGTEPRNPLRALTEEEIKELKDIFVREGLCHD